MPEEETIRALCASARRCGGCQLQNLTYPEQLACKQRLVKRFVGKFCPVLPIIGMEDPYHYRNKVQAAFTTDSKGRILSGVYQSGTHRVVPVNSCFLEDQTADRIIVTIRKLLPRFKLTTYDERTHRGFLRHVLIRQGFATGEIMVVIVSPTPVFPKETPSRCAVSRSDLIPQAQLSACPFRFHESKPVAHLIVQRPHSPPRQRP